VFKNWTICELQAPSPLPPFAFHFIYYFVFFQLVLSQIWPSYKSITKISSTLGYHLVQAHNLVMPSSYSLQKSLSRETPRKWIFILLDQPSKQQHFETEFQLRQAFFSVGRTMPNDHQACHIWATQFFIPENTYSKARYIYFNSMPTHTTHLDFSLSRNMEFLRSGTLACIQAAPFHIPPSCFEHALDLYFFMG
jgi:hypothetical protein